MGSAVRFRWLVDLVGLEPTASRLRGECSTSDELEARGYFWSFILLNWFSHQFSTARGAPAKPDVGNGESGRVAHSTV